LSPVITSTRCKSSVMILVLMNFSNLSAEWHARWATDKIRAVRALRMGEPCQPGQLRLTTGVGNWGRAAAEVTIAMREEVYSATFEHLLLPVILRDRLVAFVDCEQCVWA
jgi:hypothetical protein